MAVTLPTTPSPSSARPRLRRFGGDLTPPGGGRVQRISRLGSRYAVEVEYPPMTRAQAVALIAAIVRADTLGDTIVATWPQAALPTSLGAPLVNGASQLGSSLAADGFTAGVVIPAGSFFSFTAGGRLYLHQTTAAIAAGGTGIAVLPIGPMLRASPADNAALSFATPQVEGYVEGPEIPWSVDTALHYGLSFTLAENA